MFNRILFVTTVATCLATVVGFLARSWWVFELFSHFRVQYLVVLAGCGIIFLARKRHREVVLAIVFAIVNFSVIGNFHGESAVQASIASSEKRTLRALMVNVNNGNHAYEKLYNLVRRSSPDFVVLLEINEAWTYALHPLLRHYPYARIQDNEFGIALLSRIPLEGADIRTIGRVGLPSIVARFRIDGQQLTLIGAHTLSPTSRVRAEIRNQQLTEVAEFVSNQEDSVILLGDLNVTPWSPYFTDFLRTAGLRDSREGFGLQPTWPTRFPPFWIPIDHALVSSNVRIHKREVGPHIGSDHYPVVIDFTITAKRLAQSAKRRQTTDYGRQDWEAKRKAQSAKRRKKEEPRKTAKRIEGRGVIIEDRGLRIENRVMMGPRLRAKSKI